MQLTDATTKRLKQASRLAALLWCFTLGGNSYAQLVETFRFTELNRAIPDGQAAGLSDVRTVTSAIASVATVRIKLHVAGEFNGNLYGYVRQVNAAGTNFCGLLNRPGRSATNLDGYADAGFNVTFAATATNGDIHNYQLITTVPDGEPLTGEWQPDGRTNDPSDALASQSPTTSLSSFAGANGAGEWTLFLADLAVGGTNQLVNWEIELTGAAYPTLIWTNPASLTYGTALSGTQLNATATYNSTNVAGTFTYSPASGTVLAAGASQTLSVTFTPADTASFLPVSTNVSLTVIAATNHPPTASVMTVTRTAGLALLIARSDVATNWNDADGDTITLTSINRVTTNSVNLLTNSAWILYPNSANVNDQFSYSLRDSRGATNIGYVNIVVNRSVTGTNSITRIVVGQPTTLTAYGIPSYSYRAERATNLYLPTWVIFSTNTAASNGVITILDYFSDLGSNAPASAYYRLKWQP